MRTHSWSKPVPSPPSLYPNLISPLSALLFPLPAASNKFPVVWLDPLAAPAVTNKLPPAPVPDVLSATPILVVVPKGVNILPLESMRSASDVSPVEIAKSDALFPLLIETIRQPPVFEDWFLNKSWAKESVVVLLFCILSVAPASRWWLACEAS